jgi:schlafen family protein
MLLETLDQVTADSLRKLCEDQCPESDTLEFKREIAGRLDKDKHELLKDVCAFANSDGGDLVFGIQEITGAASTLVPLTGESADAAKRRLSQVLDAGLEPRVQGLKFHHVDVDSGYVLILRVPTSYDGPHCVRNNNNRRFVMRNGTSTTDMTFDQLRAAFDRTATLAERARRFIEDRLQMIMDLKTPKKLINGPLFVIHFVPIAGLAGRRTIDLQAIYSGEYTKFMRSNWGSGDRTFNLDGLVVHPGSGLEQIFVAYNHIFRIGALEGVSIGGEKKEVSPGVVRSLIWSVEMSQFFHSSTDIFLGSAKRWGYTGPAILSFAVLHVDGYELYIDVRRFSQALSDRPHLILPETWIENIESADIDAIVRPLMDMLWQAFGMEKCPDFDANTGTYKPRRL